MKATCYCIMLIGLSGCVSVSISSQKAQRAVGVHTAIPAAPFEKAASDSVDAVWRNPKTGNAISYLSECNDESDPSLPAIEQGVLSGVFPYTYLGQSDSTFEGRAARTVQVKGHVDGVPSLVDLMIFKKNNCIYILSYVGLEKHHSKDMPVFENFIRGFHAP